MWVAGIVKFERMMPEAACVVKGHVGLCRGYGPNWALQRAPAAVDISFQWMKILLVRHLLGVLDPVTEVQVM
jgi:hypothetical protein